MTLIKVSFKLESHVLDFFLPGKRELTISIALTKLDAELGKLQLPASAIPIRLISVGGYVAVKHLGNRKSTFDIDYVLDPTLENSNQVKLGITAAIFAVAEALDYQHTWMNDDCKVFTGGRQRRLGLFSDTLRQNVVLWLSKHLIIFAGEWQWAFGLKLRRIAETRIQTDLDDAVCILKELEARYGPLSKDYLGNFIPNQKSTVDLIVQTYEKTYGKFGIE